MNTHDGTAFDRRGFDEPLLQTMYVDKRLSGIQSVQTLSQLNRICARNKDTFAFDFSVWRALLATGDSEGRWRLPAALGAAGNGPVRSRGRRPR